MCNQQGKTIMLVGDSMIEYFDWQSHFKDLTMTNLGRSGETVEELLMRSHQIVQHFAEPDIILIMIGTNNVAMENFSFQESYQGIIDLFNNAYPKAGIIINSLLPMNLYYMAADTVHQINLTLQQLATANNASYLDVWSSMIDSTGKPLPNILADEVHITNNGYLVWAKVLKKLLNDL